MKIRTAIIIISILGIAILGFFIYLLNETKQKEIVPKVINIETKNGPLEIEINPEDDEESVIQEIEAKKEEEVKKEIITNLKQSVVEIEEPIEVKQEKVNNMKDLLLQ